VSEPKKELQNGRYVLLRKLGEGAQGETYEAIDTGEAGAGDAGTARKRSLVEDWERYVRDATQGKHPPPPRPGERLAIKCFRVGQAKAWKDVELAEREAATLASLDHPRLPKYITHFEEDGSLYLVMQKIEGDSLASLRTGAGKRPWSAAEVTRLIEHGAEALHYLHGQSPFIVHRDIKPGNVIRRPDGSFAIVDFGSVRDRLKPAGGSTVVGTFGYMAPEQFQGRASPKSDVYGLGATALAMLTGMEPEDLPHEGLGIDVARAVPLGTPAGLVRALEAMLAPNPDDRVNSADEALALLREAKGRGKSRRGKGAMPPMPPMPSTRRERHDDREAKRERKRKRKRDERWAKQRTKALARGRLFPLVPRMLARLGLLIALLVVWVTVGLVTPLVLVVLSLLFGAGLRRAAARCVQATRRSQAAIGRASAWLSGHPEREAEAAGATAENPARVRVAEFSAATGEDADAWMEEHIERETHASEAEEERAQRQQVRLHAQDPVKHMTPKRRSSGR
jgi:serine/threonine protein kinase